PWVVQSWLVSTLYALTERIAGLGGLRVVGGLLVAALLALAWHLTAGAGTPVPRLGIMALLTLVAGPFWSARPLLLGPAPPGVVLSIVVGEWDPRWLVPVMWVWVNAHGSFVLGPVAVACFCLGRFLDGERQRSVWRPLAWVAGGTVAGAVNPLGPTLLVFPLH